MDLKPNRPLTEWLNAANPEERKELAKRAKTSLPHLQHVAHGRRSVSADLAQRIAHAAKHFPLNPELFQTDLCQACGRCPLLNGK